jgi:hypothetical protein
MPGQYYLYIPFTDQECNEQLIENAREWRKNIAEHSRYQAADARKIPTIVECGSAELTKLRSLNPDDYTLYIMAHCNSGKDRINNINMFTAERKMLSAVDLVRRLADDGLPEDIKHLKLYACNGGSPKGYELPFAFGLAFALKDAGFYQVIVTGYVSPLKAIAIRTALPVHKLTNLDKPASSVSRRFDGEI